MAQSLGGQPETSSFRDPAGVIFWHGGKAYRQINRAGKADYDSLMDSGLYDRLVKEGILISHSESKVKGISDEAYKVILPLQLDFVSYPYEWSFSQLKDAALVTLKAQKLALEKNLVLKDASAYNVQFLNGQPILIDTLSFEPYGGQRAWQAYRQFCQHFLAPLALMSRTHISLNSLLRDHIDGVPLDLADALLPAHYRLRPGLLLHIGMHSRSQKKYADRPVTPSNAGNPVFARRAMLGLADSLERSVGSLKAPANLETEWGKYYQATNYSDRAMKQKIQMVTEFVKASKANTVWDLGGNTGRFSRAALAAGAKAAICFDIDPVAVESNFRHAKKAGETNLLPLLLDLTNPSPALGWAHAERQSLQQRAKSDNLIMALALIHHLAISNNLPFEHIARFFARLGSQLIIEFVPKKDSQVQRLLATRKDIFGQYNQESFEAAFGRYYKIKRAEKIPGSSRVLYLMAKK